MGTFFRKRRLSRWLRLALLLYYEVPLIKIYLFYDPIFFYDLIFYEAI